METLIFDSEQSYGISFWREGNTTKYRRLGESKKIIFSEIMKKLYIFDFSINKAAEKLA